MTRRALLPLVAFFLLCEFSNAAWRVAYDSGLRTCPCTTDILIHVKRKARLSVRAMHRSTYIRWLQPGKPRPGGISHLYEPGPYDVKHRVNTSDEWAFIVLATNRVEVTGLVKSRAISDSSGPSLVFRPILPKHVCRLRLSFNARSSALLHASRKTPPPTNDDEYELPNSERIINGALASGRTAEQSSYTVMLRYSKYLCTGSVISSRWILSAAHCHHQIGSKVYLSRNRESQAYITRVYRHPNFKATRYAAYDDIALLEIDRPLHVTKLKLYNGTATRLVNRFARESGFGRFSITKGTDKRLRVADTPVISFSACKKQIRRIRKFLSATALDPYHHICTDSRNCGVSACSGDSGAPLCVRGSNREHVQIGVVSYTIRRCSAAPDIFANIGIHAEWISSVTDGAVQFTDKLYGDAD